MDFTSYAAGYIRRIEHSRARACAHREQLYARLPEAVQHLVQANGVRRVTLFGSLARAEARPGSDVDLLVEGLPAEALFRATAELTRILESDVDLVPRERARLEVLARAAIEGRVLHG